MGVSADILRRKRKLKRAIYAALESGRARVALRKMLSTRGLWEEEGNRARISIDPRNELIPTALHELIHEAYPSWEHPVDPILDAEAFLVRHMSAREMTNFLRRLVERLR